VTHGQPCIDRLRRDFDAGTQRSQQGPVVVRGTVCRAAEHRAQTIGTMNDSRKSELDPLAVGMLLACSFIWGLGQVAAKVGLQDFPPLMQGALRCLGAALLLLIWSRWRGLRVLQRDGTGRAGLLAGALFAFEFGCIFVGLQFTSASRMAVFIYLAPFVVALGMPLIGRGERLGAVGAGGLLLAFAGVVWAFAEGFVRPAAGPWQWLGDALGIVAALAWGLTTLTIRSSSLASALAEKTLLYQLSISGLALGLASLLRAERWPMHVGALPFVSLVFQIFIVTFASYLAWFWLVRHYPATKISVFTLLTPVFGLVAGVVLLGEPLTDRLLLALAAICAGIALVNRPVARA
jgi:drug/metabolite transporter (DMT)-like permease